MEIFQSFTVFLLIFCSVSCFEECGVAIQGTRIVGGNDSGGYHYPWFALLRLKTNAETAVCAGSLITPRHVLTAAHCFSINPGTPNENLFTVALGVYDRCNPNESTRQVFNVITVVVHEMFETNKKVYDIALMTLDKNADFMAVCLPYGGNQDVTEPAHLIGFGTTKEGGYDQPCHLMEANILKYSKSDCEKTDLPKQDIWGMGVFCAGNINGNVDSCQGDSGGPLHILTSNGRYTLAGIVSYGYGCGNPGLPGVYTDVSYYLNWIQDKVKSQTVQKEITSYGPNYALDNHSFNMSSFPQTHVPKRRFQDNDAYRRRKLGFQDNRRMNKDQFENRVNESNSQVIFPREGK